MDQLLPSGRMDHQDGASGAYVNIHSGRVLGGCHAREDRLTMDDMDMPHVPGAARQTGLRLNKGAYQRVLPDAVFFSLQLHGTHGRATSPLLGTILETGDQKQISEQGSDDRKMWALLVGLTPCFYPVPRHYPMFPGPV